MVILSVEISVKASILSAVISLDWLFLEGLGCFCMFLEGIPISQKNLSSSLQQVRMHRNNPLPLQNLMKKHSWSWSLNCWLLLKLKILRYVDRNLGLVPNHSCYEGIHHTPKVTTLKIEHFGMCYIFGSFFQASNKHILEEHALRKGGDGQ